MCIRDSQRPARASRRDRPRHGPGRKDQRRHRVHAARPGDEPARGRCRPQRLCGALDEAAAGAIPPLLVHALSRRRRSSAVRKASRCAGARHRQVRPCTCRCGQRQVDGLRRELYPCHGLGVTP